MADTTPMSIEQAHTETGERLLAFFTYKHLPERLQRTSKFFADLAVTLAAEIPPSAERTVALRKLLESKDAAVRAHL